MRFLCETEFLFPRIKQTPEVSRHFKTHMKLFVVLGSHINCVYSLDLNIVMCREYLKIFYFAEINSRRNTATVPLTSFFTTFIKLNI